MFIYLHFTSACLINATVKLIQLIPLRFMLIAFIARREKNSIFKRKKKGEGNLRAIAVNVIEMTETISSPF